MKQQQGISGMRAALGALLMLVASATFGAEVRQVDVRQGQALKNQGALLIDVREPHEYQQAHVPGSKLIPLGQLESRLQEIRAGGERPVVLICRSGARSMQAARLLQQHGFANLHNVSGGMIAWQREGLPTAARSD